MLITCPECQAQISDRAPACPRCGAPRTDRSSGPTARSAAASPDTSTALQQSIVHWAAQGYVVQSQVGGQAQLLKRKQFSLLFALAWLLWCGVGILFYLVYYLAKSDESVLLTIAPDGRVLVRRHVSTVNTVGMILGVIMWVLWAIMGLGLLVGFVSVPWSEAEGSHGRAESGALGRADEAGASPPAEKGARAVPGPTLADLCGSLGREVHGDAELVGDPTAEPWGPRCEPTPRIVSGPPGSPDAAIFMVEGGSIVQSYEVHFLALRTPRGWALAKELARMVQPGAGAAFRTFAIRSLQHRQVIPGGAHEVVADVVERFEDTDAGVGARDVAETSALLVCGLVGNDARCFLDVPYRSSYEEREVRFVGNETLETGRVRESTGYELGVEFDGAGNATVTKLRGDVPPAVARLLGSHAVRSFPSVEPAG